MRPRPGPTRDSWSGRATADRPTARRTPAPRDAPADRRRSRASRDRRCARRSSVPRRDTSRSRTCPATSRRRSPERGPVWTCARPAAAIASRTRMGRRAPVTHCSRGPNAARPSRCNRGRSRSSVDARVRGDADPRRSGGRSRRTRTRVDRAADVLPPRDQIQVDVRPPARRPSPCTAPVRSPRACRPHPPETIRDAVHVGVDADVPPALEREDQHEIRRLAADARQRQQFLHGAGTRPPKPLDEHPAGRFHVPRLVPIEADRIDQPLDLLDRQRRHRARRARHAESRVDAASVVAILRRADSSVAIRT